jgi:hypothetical protein
MPTYNGAAHVRAALQGVQAQADERIEILAIDDGSTDGTIAILESFAGKLPLQIVRRGHTGNWVANTNFGLSRARGEWLCFLHQDDVWYSGRLAALRALVAERPQAGLALHPSWYIDDQGKRLGLWRCPLPERSGMLPPALVLERLLVQNFIALPAPLFRRAEALRLGGLQEDLWYAADWDFWLKLAAAAPTAYLPRPLAGFRLHRRSQTIQRSHRAEDLRRQLETVLERHLEACQPPAEDAAGLQGVARFSAAMNVFLAASVHGNRRQSWRLALAFLSLGPAGWHRFLRDSRIAERVSARLRAGMRNRPPAAGNTEVVS